MKCVAQVEIDPFCRRVLTKHWPNTPKFEDVRAVSYDQANGLFSRKEESNGSFRYRGSIDLIAGGFP